MSAHAGTFPRQHQPNSKEHLNVVTLRSRKELEVATDKRDKRKETKSEHVPTEKESKQTPKENKVVEKDKEEPYVSHPPYKPQILFPQRFMK